MDAHTLLVFQTLRGALKLALACPTSDRLYRVLRAALQHVEEALGEPRTLTTRAERRAG